MERDRAMQRQIQEAKSDLQFVEDNLRRTPQSGDLQKKQTELLFKIRDLEKEVLAFKKKNIIATTAFSYSTRDKKNKNPAIDILVNLYIDNKHITPTPGQFFRVDNQMNLVSEKKKTNQLGIDRLKGMIYELDNRGGDAREKEKEKKRYMEQLAEATRTFNPHFYVTLGDISSLASFVQFTESYQGHDRSPTRVEKNIDILINLIFGKDEIRVDGKRCKIAKYSWAKEYFPPYGYQTNRGYIAIRIAPENVQFTFTRETKVRIDTLRNYIDGNTPNMKLPTPREPRTFMPDANTFLQVERALDAYLVAHFGEELQTAVAQYGAIEVGNHAALLAKPDLWYESLQPAKRKSIFVYEYLAYRFSIYHSFFSKKDWSVYSDFPYFVSLQKNSALVKRLMRLAPDATVRQHLALLGAYWLEEDQRSSQRTATIQHQLQIIYSTRLFVQIKQRVEYLQLAINYTVVQVILKEALRCAAAVRKDPALRCISKVAQKAMQMYLQEWTPHASLVLGKIPTVEPCRDAAVQFNDGPLVDLIGEVTINGTTPPTTHAYAPFKDGPLPETEMEVMQEIDRYDDYFNKMTKKNWVRRYVSLNHSLPPKLTCVFNHMQALQVHKYTMEMNEALKDWEKERANMTKTNKTLALLLDNTCMNSTRGLLGNDPCIAQIKRAYDQVKTVAAKYLKRANLDDSAVQFSLLQERYDAWYAPLKDLQDKYTETFGFFRDTCMDLTALVGTIQKDDKNYNQRVNQFDYVIDAFQTLGAVEMPLEPVSVPTFCEEVEDYGKATKYFNVLFDLLENKVLRGIMWGSDFKYERPPCQHHDDVKRVLTSPNFLKEFAALDPMCVAEYISTDLDDLATAEVLYEKAIEFISEGQFELGEEAVLLALLFKHKADAPSLYQKCKQLLIYVWESVGKHVKVRQIEGYKKPSYFARRAYLQHYIRLLRSESPRSPDVLDFIILVHDVMTFNPSNWTRRVDDKNEDVWRTSRYDKAIAERVVQFSRSTGTFSVSGVVKSLFDKFLKWPKGGAEYHAALVNYRCMQAAVKGDVARQILTDEHLKEADLSRVLRYFPPEHNVSNIVGQINAALNHTDFEDTFKLVAGYIYKHRRGGREVVYETKGKCPKLDISRAVAKLEKVDDKLHFVASLTANADAERENDWPNKLEDVTVALSIANKLKLLNRTESFPHVDGNYTLRCVVTLKLLQDSKPAVTCEEKSKAAWDLLRAMTT